LAACFFLPLAAFAASPAQEGPAPSVAQETIGLGEHNLRMTVPITIEGEGPYHFLIDTGAERTIISDSLADRLSLRRGSFTRVHSMSGPASVQTVVVPEIRVSKSRKSEVEAPALKEANIGASGMLGLDMLRSQRVIFDFENQKMTVSPSRSGISSFDPNTIIVKGRSRFGRMVLVDAWLDGERIMVVLDTGSQVTIGNEALRSRLVRKKKLGRTEPVELVSVLGGVVSADYAPVRSLRIGGVHLEDLPMAFADVHPFRQLDLRDRPAILLGMDVLRMFDRVSVDFANKKVSFRLPDVSSRGDIRMARLASRQRLLR
jgi:predicted aspartyl protease